MSEWKHISSAPKIEGVHYLGFDEETAAAHGRRDAGLCIIRWVDAYEDFEGGWEVMPFAEGLDVVYDPIRLSCWKPLPDDLPPPPSELEGA